MIPTNVLLPALSAKDCADFESLRADFHAARTLVSAYNSEALAKKKKELKAKMKSAPHDKLLTIGAELETLDASFQTAKRAARQKLKALAPRYAALLPRLLDLAQTHANELIASAKLEYERHFAAFQATPTGESPLVPHVTQWKRNLTSNREQLDLAIAANSILPAPESILPYPKTT